MMLLGLSQAAPPEQPLAASSTVALSPEEELQEAVRKYQRRQLSSAIVSFHELATRPDIPLDVRQEARIFLGEIQLQEGNPDRAAEEFRKVIEADPHFRIDQHRFIMHSPIHALKVG